MMRVYLVDDEQDLVWATVKRASRERPDLVFKGFVDAHEALDAIRAEPPDVLVTDLRMPSLSGFRLLMAARDLAPGLPVVLMTAYGSPALRQEVARRGSVVYLEKPFSIDQLLSGIDQLLQQETGFSGSVAKLSFADLVQIQALARFSGALEVTGAGQNARLYFVDGDILHAECDGLTGAEVVRSVLGWDGGSFRLLQGEATREQTIREGWQTLLLDACRLLDETDGQTNGETFDGETFDGETFDGDLIELVELVEPLAHDLVADSTTSVDHTRDRTTRARAGPHRQELGMGNVKESLERLQDIDGFMGACVVDSNSGMMLGSHGGGVNLEVAAAGNTEVVRAKLKTMKALGLNDAIEDILITLGKQYHLIRPLTNRDGLFAYCVLDKAKANLGMSRYQLAAVEKELQV